MEFYFEGATLSRAPEVFQRRTSTLYHVGGHGARGQARIQLKGHHKRGNMDVFLWLSFFLFLNWMHAYSLDMWMLN